MYICVYVRTYVCSVCMYAYIRGLQGDCLIKGREGGAIWYAEDTACGRGRLDPMLKTGRSSCLHRFLIFLSK
jgi:hypothetical protein